MKKFKFFALLLAICLVVSSLASCDLGLSGSNNETDSETDSKTISSEENGSTKDEASESNINFGPRDINFDMPVRFK